MTQSQTDLYNAAEAALKDAQQKIAYLCDVRLLGQVAPVESRVNHEAAAQAQLKITEALLWLREI